MSESLRLRVSASKNLSPEQRRIRASLAGFGRWERVAVEDRSGETSPGRTAFMDRFSSAKDPISARKRYFKTLALKSSQKRGARKRDLSRVRELAGEMSAEAPGDD